MVTVDSNSVAGMPCADHRRWTLLKNHQGRRGYVRKKVNVPLTLSVIGAVSRGSRVFRIRPFTIFRTRCAKLQLEHEIHDVADALGGMSNAAVDPTFLHRLEMRLQERPELRPIYHAYLSDPHEPIVKSK